MKISFIFVKKPSLSGLNLTIRLIPDVKNIAYISELSPSTLYNGIEWMLVSMSMQFTWLLIDWMLFSSWLNFTKKGNKDVFQEVN